MSQTATEFIVDETLLPLSTGSVSFSSLHDQIVVLIKRRAELARKLQQTERQAEQKKRQLLLALLEVADAFDRIFQGINLAELDEVSRHFIGNFRTTNALLENVLDQEDVMSMEELEGQIFDPHLQEVVGIETRAAGPDELILEVKGKGYYWHDKLLRRAKVIVSKVQ